MEALGANLDALGANLGALGANSGALEANLSALGANLDALGAYLGILGVNVGRVLAYLEHAWAFALMCCAKRCDAVLSSSAVSVFCAKSLGMKANIDVLW